MNASLTALLICVFTQLEPEPAHEIYIHPDGNALVAVSGFNANADEIRDSLKEIPVGDDCRKLAHELLKRLIPEMDELREIPIDTQVDRERKDLLPKISSLDWERRTIKVRWYEVAHRGDLQFLEGDSDINLSADWPEGVRGVNFMPPPKIAVQVQSSPSRLVCSVASKLCSNSIVLKHDQSGKITSSILFVLQTPEARTLLLSK